MWHGRERKFKQLLMLAAMSCLSSCAPAVCETNILPQFPYAGPQVAAELQNLSAEDYPYFWDWLARINKLRMELENQ